MGGRASRDRLRIELEADPGDRRHGTITGYTVGCRCERCRSAYRSYWQALRRDDEGLRRGPWTTGEIARLVELYSEGADAATLRAELKRTLPAIRAQARRQHVARARPNARGKRRKRMSINRVNISGNLTRDPETRTTAGGTAVMSFGLAVNDRRKNPQTGEWEDFANFVDCAMFGKRAEALRRYLAKGSKVAVEGKLRYSSWEKDGQRRSKLEVIVDELELMSRSDSQQAAPAPQYGQQAAYAPQQAAPQVDVYDEEIPF